MANLISNYAILYQESKPIASQRKKIQFTSAGFLQSTSGPQNCIRLKVNSVQQLSQPSCSSVAPAASTSDSSNATPDSITEELTNVPSPSDLRRRLIETSDEPSVSTNGIKTNGTAKLDGISPKNSSNFIGPQMPPTTIDNSQVNRKRRASETLEDEAHFPVLDGRICHDGWRNCKFLNNHLSANGLYNELNDCFLNAVLQSIVHTPHLARYIYDHEFINCNKRLREGKCLYCTLKNFIYKIVNESRPIHTRSFLRQHMHDIFPAHRAGTQEDAHEMLCLLLSALEPPIPKSLSNGTPKILQKTSTPIEQIFGGTLKNQFKCEVCGTIHTNYERIREINLGLRLKKYEGRTDLSEIINDYFQPEKIHSFLCKQCKVKRIAVRTTIIVRAPSVLLVQLKRFNVYGNKINLPVLPEVDLNLSQYMYNNEMTKYRLNGLIQHLGHSVNSGHYIAAMRGFDGQSWFKYDDESVNRVSLDSVRSMQPYILFYIRQNVDAFLQNKRLQLNPKLNQTAPPMVSSSPGPSTIPNKLPKISPFAIQSKFNNTLMRKPNGFIN